MKHEVEYDDHTLILIETQDEDLSYDDEFGRVRFPVVEVIRSIHVIVYIRGMDYDVTSSIRPEELEIFQDFAQEYIDKINDLGSEPRVKEREDYERE